MADAIRDQHNVSVHVTRGWLGEFTVRLDDGRVLARRRWLRLPLVDEVVRAVTRAVATP